MLNIFITVSDLFMVFFSILLFIRLRAFLWRDSHFSSCGNFVHVIGRRLQESVAICRVFLNMVVGEMIPASWFACYNDDIVA